MIAEDKTVNEPLIHSFVLCEGKDDPDKNGSLEVEEKKDDLKKANIFLYVIYSQCIISWNIWSFLHFVML